MLKKIGAILVIIVLIYFVLHELGTHWIFYSKTIILNKDLILVCKDLITIIAIVGGAILTYYRFFKGRTFSAKADIEIDISLIETPANSIMHVIKFCIINKGTTTIWKPIAKIGIRSFSADKTNYEVIDNILENSFFDDPNKNHYYMVDPGEKVFFIHYKEFEKSIWAVSYDIEISSKDNDIWKNSSIISNKI